MKLLYHDIQDSLDEKLDEKLSNLNNKMGNLNKQLGRPLDDIIDFKLHGPIKDQLENLLYEHQFQKK